MPHQRTASQQQIGTGTVESLIHKEVFLFPTEVARYLFHAGVEIVTHIGSSDIDSMERPEQWSFIVEGLTCIADKHCGDAKRVVDDEDRTCRIPCRVATCLEGTSYSTAWERTCIWLLLYQQLAREILYHSTFSIVFDE